MMKKTKTAIVLTLILIAGMAFAQELKFDGYVNSGLGLVITDREDADGTVDPYIAAYGVDSEQTLFRFRLNGSYTNADGNVGAKFRFQAQTNNQGQYPILPYAFGWVKFFDILTVNAGIVNDSTWESKGAILTDDQGEGLGVLVKVSPIKGLDLGVGAYTSNSGSGSVNNALSNATPSAVDWNEAKYTVNGSYTMPDLFKLNATYRGENRASRDRKSVV
jgi:hypothetical protein